ncbi:MAG: thioredoxin [Solirubrobacteraceae bacterium]
MASLRRILSRESQAPALDGATAWLNSEPLAPADLEDRVVAYDFWTYTCVNWLRTLPYLRAWHERYHEHGLTVIGVHTPEFEFERELANVQEAIVVDGIDYAVAVDSDYAIWTAFANNYWPALYIADATGTLRHHQFGESDYEKAESIIRLLLAEAGTNDLPSSAGDVHAEGAEIAADWDHLASPETYLGFARGQRFASERADHAGAYVVPVGLRLNEWGVAGAWTIRQDRAHLDHGVGTIAYRFRARDVNLVMCSPRGETPFRVSIDGAEPGASAGVDCDARGDGVVDEPRMYQLIRQRDTAGDHTFEITFAAPGVDAYVFTFG